MNLSQFTGWKSVVRGRVVLTSKLYTHVLYEQLLLELVNRRIRECSHTNVNYQD